MREEVTADYILHAHKLHEMSAIANSDQEQYVLLQTHMEKYEVAKLEFYQF